MADAPETALQRAVHAVLLADAGLLAAFGGTVRAYDRVPGAAGTGGRPTLPYISYGPTDSQNDGDGYCIDSQTVQLQVDVWSDKPGKAEAQSITDLIMQAVSDREDDLSSDEHHFISVRVLQRRVFTDADGLTTHGVVVIEAMIERDA